MTIGLDTLPTDLQYHIASLLCAKDLARLGACSKFWQEFCNTPSLWKRLSQQLNLPSLMDPSHPNYNNFDRYQVIQATINPLIDVRLSILVKEGKIPEARAIVSGYGNPKKVLDANSFINAAIVAKTRKNL